MKFSLAHELDGWTHSQTAIKIYLNTVKDLLIGIANVTYYRRY
jgi:hypothetical protein